MKHTPQVTLMVALASGLAGSSSCGSYAEEVRKSTLVAYSLSRKNQNSSSRCPLATKSGMLLCNRESVRLLPRPIVLTSVKTYTTPREDISGVHCGADLCIWSDNDGTEFVSGLYNVESSLSTASAVILANSGNEIVYLVVHRQAGGEYTAEAYIPWSDLKPEHLTKIQSIIERLGNA